MSVVRPSDCRCVACIDLAAGGVGWDGADQLARGLVRRGWAGSRTSAETAWLRRHPPPWWAKQRQAAVEASRKRNRAP